ncbi:MAG: EscU/YscU/HrcU family type III secretion system export apparatus switch protein [Pirellulaceae bacterium]|nr:EscU/YscU/HrcU family type III secretion system export apparatus switch protein [Planctomycetales bacterium]
MSDERRHEPSARRRRRAREQGRVAKSHDLTAAASLLVSLAAVWMFGGQLWQFLGELGSDALRHADVSGNAEADFVANWRRLTMAGLLVLAPILGAAALAAAVPHWAQHGFRLQTLGNNSGRSSLASRLGSILSVGSVMRTASGLIKLAVVLGIAGWALWNERHALLSLGAYETAGLAARMSELLLTTLLKITAGLLVLGAIDYGYQWWRLEQSLRMTDEELREELREDEGDRRLAAKRRELHRQNLARDAQATHRVVN